MKASIDRCEFKNGVTSVYYPAGKLFKAAEASPEETDATGEAETEADEGGQ